MNLVLLNQLLILIINLIIRRGPLVHPRGPILHYRKRITRIVQGWWCGSTYTWGCHSLDCRKWEGQNKAC